MASIPFAFSVHHFVNSVGAYAGFAAIIGLAILVLLYFAQARETASLREQAHETAQYIQQLENRIAQLVRQPVAPAPAPVTQLPIPSRPIGAPDREPAIARAAAPAVPEVGPPAGVGAPALTAATKLIPAGAVPAFAGEEPDLTTVGSPAPATVAGGANGHGASAPAPAPAPVGAAVGAGRTAVADPDGPPPPRIQIRPSAGAGPSGRRTPPPPRRPVEERPSRGRRVLLALLALIVVAGVVVALLVLTGNNSSQSASSSQSANSTNGTTTTAAHHRRKPAAAFSPSSVTVAVLNGTATAQLAHRVATNLASVGYKQGNVATAADQTRTATVVAYLPGHEHDALEVAKALKLGQASVQPIDQNTQAVACPPGTPCTAVVVVTVGSDLANIQ